MCISDIEYVELCSSQLMVALPRRYVVEGKFREVKIEK